MESMDALLVSLKAKFDRPWLSCVLRGRLTRLPVPVTGEVGPAVILTISRTFEYEHHGRKIADDVFFDIEAIDALTTYENTDRGRLKEGDWILAVCTLRPVKIGQQFGPVTHACKPVALCVQLVDGPGED